jgi:hypothetical protein
LSQHDSWSFTIGDAGRLIGKAPVTIRLWESKGLVTIPRKGGDRRFTLDEMQSFAEWTYHNSKISLARLDAVTVVLNNLREIERMNIDKLPASSET